MEMLSYAGELVVPEPLDAVRRRLPFKYSQWKFSALNFVPVVAGSVSILQ